ncbi:hypothetical protein NCCP2495_19340 [Dietzia sp. NCCP-2495]|nr:hypothetical protein NCCP2495_19340 [Dietzia sp. NCCP-2495]
MVPGMSSTTSRSVFGITLAVAVVAGIGWCSDQGGVAGPGETGASGEPGISQTVTSAAPSSSGPASTPPSAPAPGTDAALPPPPPGEPAPPAPGPPPDPLIPAARAAVGQLEVKGRAPKTGYDRDLFGQAWSDDVGVEFGHNGCDTRNDILRRDLVEATLKPGTRDCVVLTGVLTGPYSGERIEFQRGQGTSSQVQVDHVVALSDAWQKGAQRLTVDQRRDFANDPLNLLAVAGHVNQSKSDGDAATWLPPRREFRCSYVARQVMVKERYGLWVTHAERDAIDRVLATC